ncbi:hypothetical protein [Streptomyces xinghaiensis]|uniref:DUF7134 domain-containing protein n=1 Tax=Streptomyces xinghaiensis TaxID=1038928 RepID=UPI002E0FCA4D|nr:hypothetical protein OG463_22740 [Streptomyces xinghaiensis]
MGDVSRRRLILLDAAAALGFALLPQLSVLRPDTGGTPGGLTAWLLPLAAALPLAVRRLWPVPVLAAVLAASCAALAAGLGPAVLLAPAYALYPVATTRQRRPGRSAVLVGVASAGGAALLAVTGGQAYEGGTLAVHLLFGLLVLGATWAAGTAVGCRRFPGPWDTALLTFVPRVRPGVRSGARLRHALPARAPGTGSRYGRNRSSPTGCPTRRSPSASSSACRR